MTWKPSTRRTAMLATAMSIAAAFAGQQSADAQSPVDVGKQPSITILINSSPWYAGFEKVADLYSQQTGNQVKLDVTPYGGMLEKARNAVRGASSPYDLLNIDGHWVIEFYEGKAVKPIHEIDPTFQLPKEVLECGNNHYWNEVKRYRTPEGGKLMAVPPNCNVHILAYRKDLFDKAGLAEPKTFDDVLDACKKLKSPPSMYGFVTRGERGNPIRYDFTTFMIGHGGEVVANAQEGDFTVTVNSPKVLAALDQYITLQKTCAPANFGSVGQADVIQLMATGKVASVLVVIAAWSNFEDKTKSAVAGKVAAAPVPAALPGGRSGAVIGNWDFAIPVNTTPERQKAAVAFLKWFVTAQTQRAYAEAGGIPVRADTLTSDLASKPQYAWMPAYLASVTASSSSLGYTEGSEVEQVLGLKLNQALIGELSPSKALNEAANEIYTIFERSGRKTGKLPPLPE
jgi:multiple sugar transport system substrate-binding protein